MITALKNFYETTGQEQEEEMWKYLNKNIEYDIPPMPKWVKVMVHYPFHGLYARVRFEVRGHKDAYVSTYLDVNNRAGIMSGPYFEAYPIKGEAERYLYADQPSMYKDVLAQLRRYKKELEKKK